ncbi:pyridoxamine 5'-phosphate oxidase family protein [bacterium]|nr:pyridoxamine 5'-phosphate oxidase family protein [bacterium]
MPKQWITDRAALDALLARAQAGCLATVGADGLPYATPVNFLYADGCVYIHSALTGRKLANIASQPVVSFSVFEMERLAIGDSPCSCSTRYQSVLIEGRASIVEDGPAKARRLAELTGKYAGRSLGLPSDEACRRTALIEIHVERLTGKRNVD